MNGYQPILLTLYRWECLRKIMRKKRRPPGTQTEVSCLIMLFWLVYTFPKRIIRREFPVSIFAHIFDISSRANQTYGNGLFFPYFLLS